MKIENIYRLEFAFAFCFRICICVLLLSSSPGRKYWLGGKVSTPRPGPLARIWNTSHLPAYQIYHLNLFTYHWLKEKGVDRFVFIYHPFFLALKWPKWKRPNMNLTLFTRRPLWTNYYLYYHSYQITKMMVHFLLLVLLYLFVEEVVVFNTMWWVCGDGNFQGGGRKGGGAGADGGESIFQRSIIRISLGTCPEDWIFHIWRAQKRSNAIEMQASHANPTTIMGSAFFSLIALTIAFFKEVVKGSAVSFWGGGR